MKVLVTCPPMLRIIDEFTEFASDLGLELVPANVKQTLSEDELVEKLPLFDGWIIGDDPASLNVVKAGSKGLLKAAVKWGIGIDNVNFEAFKSLGIKITNTPGMFGKEVADLSVCYLNALTRNIIAIDREVRNGNWIKPTGYSLEGKTVAIIGFGDIGQNTAKRLLAADMNIIIYDPYVDNKNEIYKSVKSYIWPNNLNMADFIIVNCSLTESSFHMINDETIKLMKKGVSIINVGRGPIIDEKALINNLESGHIKSVALDVFEKEPLDINSPFMKFKDSILGSHNASNTYEAVSRTSRIAIEKLAAFLK